jgi:hypothetical protein
MSANLDLVRTIFAAWGRRKVKTVRMRSCRSREIDQARAAAERLAESG